MYTAVEPQNKYVKCIICILFLYFKTTKKLKQKKLSFPEKGKNYFSIWQKIINLIK